MKKRCKGIVYDDNLPRLEELHRLVEAGKGDYTFLCDPIRHRTQNLLNYLDGVLRQISNHMPSHPSRDTLYRFFELKFAPEKVAITGDERLTYKDLKKLSSTELSEAIDSIVQFAESDLGIVIVSGNTGLQPVSEPYWGAYKNQWQGHISSC